MGNKYNEVMKHIEVTLEMRDRILCEIDHINFTEKNHRKFVPFQKIKLFPTLAACIAVILIAAFALPDFLHISHESPAVENSSIVETSTLKELSETVGFNVSSPGILPFEPNNITYTAYWTETAEITYTNGGQTAVFRQGIGSDDVSGDYNSYSLTAKMSIRGINATLKGNGKNYTLALWTDDNFSYSLSLSKGIGKTEWTEILKTVIKVP